MHSGGCSVRGFWVCVDNRRLHSQAGTPFPIASLDIRGRPMPGCRKIRTPPDTMSIDQLVITYRRAGAGMKGARSAGVWGTGRDAGDVAGARGVSNRNLFARRPQDLNAFLRLMFRVEFVDDYT